MVFTDDVRKLKSALRSQLDASTSLYNVVNQLISLAEEISDQNEEAASKILKYATEIFDQVNNIRESTKKVAKVIIA